MDSPKRVVLVIGASRGIGREIAIDLAKEGANLIVNYRSKPDASEEVVKVIKEMGREATFIKVDVANKRLVAISDWRKPKEMK
jgi:3-oxoacyl-[acyl-carrier protein] reductase